MSSLIFLTQLMRVEAAAPAATPCTLAWDLSPDPTVCGYSLFYGITGSTITNRVDVGNTNMVTLKSLLASSNYFFYVVASDIYGTKSPPSTAMYYRPAALSELKLTQLADTTMSLHFLAATGAVCHVEYSPTLNPSQWQTLAGATADANGNVTLIDPLTGNPPARFYRTVLP